jgi:hypothetical protein
MDLEETLFAIDVLINDTAEPVKDTEETFLVMDTKETLLVTDT